MNSNGRGVRRLKRAAARTSTLEMDAPPAAGDEEASAVRALFGARSVEAEHQLRREEAARRRAAAEAGGRRRALERGAEREERRHAFAVRRGALGAGRIGGGAAPSLRAVAPPRPAPGPLSSRGGGALPEGRRGRALPPRPRSGARPRSAARGRRLAWSRRRRPACACAPSAASAGSARRPPRPWPSTRASVRPWGCARPAGSAAPHGRRPPGSESAAVVWRLCTGAQPGA